MTPQQFWSGNLVEFMLYMKAHNRKEVSKYMEMDTLAWNIGAYLIKTLQATPLMSYGMTPGKDIKRILQDYPKKPMAVMQKEEEEQKQKVALEKRKADKPTSEQLAIYSQLLAKAKEKRKRKEE